MKRFLAPCFGALLALAPIPAFAVIAISAALGSGQSNSAAHSVATSSFSASANTLVLVVGNVTGLNNAADVLSITDSAAGAIGAWTVVQCATPGATTKISWMAYAYTSAGFTSKTVTVADTTTGGTNWTNGAAIVAFDITGGATSAFEDSTQRACGGSTSGTTNPSLTSATPTGAGELAVANYYGQRATSGASYTEDNGNGWGASALYGPFGGAQQADSGGSQLNAGSSAVTHNPTVTSAAYAHQILWFCPSGGCSAGGVTTKRGTLLGVGP